MEWFTIPYIQSKHWSRPRVCSFSCLIGLIPFPFLYMLKNRLKNLIFQFLSFHLWMMVLLLCRTNQLTFLTLISFVVIMYFPNFSTVLVSPSNMWKLKFNRLHGVFNPPQLDLSPIDSPTLRPKKTWKYLGFIFDRKLMFYQHIDHYSNKAISSVKCIKLLGNLLWGTNPVQKCQLYRCCVLPIALYSFQL